MYLKSLAASRQQSPRRPGPREQWAPCENRKVAQLVLKRILPPLATNPRRKINVKKLWKGVGKGSPKLTTTSPSGPKGVSQTDDDNCRQPLPPSAKIKTTTVECAIWYPGHPLSNEGDNRISRIGVWGCSSTRTPLKLLHEAKHQC